MTDDWIVILEFRFFGSQDRTKTVRNLERLRKRLLGFCRRNHVQWRKTLWKPED